MPALKRKSFLGLSMENTSKNKKIAVRDIAYYRQRNKNRLLEQIAAFFAEQAEVNGITKKEIAYLLDKDPSQITKWLSTPSNLTLDTISDVLLAMDAEMDYQIVRFADRREPNYQHPLIQELSGKIGFIRPRKKKDSIAEESKTATASTPTPSLVKKLELIP